MKIFLKRVYEAPAEDDGCRILVERLWPRGVSKDKAAIDWWPRELAPSTELRRWFDHQEQRWEEFRKRYWSELEEHGECLQELRERLAAGPVSFVFAARETRFNNALALKELLERDSGGESACESHRGKG